MSNVALFALGGLVTLPRGRRARPARLGSDPGRPLRRGAARGAPPRRARGRAGDRSGGVGTLRSQSRSRELAGAIRSGGVLDALRAAAELRRLPAARVDPRPLLRAAVGSGDVLARAASGYALGRRPEAAVDRALLSLLQDDEPTLREVAALTLAHRRPWSPALSALRREAAGGGFGGMLAELARSRSGRGTLREAPVRGLRGPRFGSGLRVAQVVLQGRLDAGLREPGRGTEAVSPRSSSTSRGRSAAVPRSTTS